VINIISIKDLISFIRFRIAFQASFLALAGYLLSHAPDTRLIFVFLTSFLGLGGVYAYNDITDKKEDLVNRKRINPFVDNKGLLIATLCFFFGGICSLFLPNTSTFFYLSLIMTGLIYSRFRIKRYLLIKNLYTGFWITQAFLLGNMSFTYEALLYYLLFSILFFVGSLISDLRDYNGDKSAGIITIPVRFGYEQGKNLVYFFIFLVSALIVTMDLNKLLILLPFSFLAIFFLNRDRADVAHVCGGFSIIFLVIRLIA